MIIATYEKNTMDGMVEEIGTDSFLNNGVNNVTDFEMSARAMKAAAALGAKAYAELEAMYGASRTAYASHLGSRFAYDYI